MKVLGKRRPRLVLRMGFEEWELFLPEKFNSADTAPETRRKNILAAADRLWNLATQKN